MGYTENNLYKCLNGIYQEEYIHEKFEDTKSSKS